MSVDLTDKSIEIPENVRITSASRGAWAGIRLDVVGIQFSGGEVHDRLPYSEETRLSVVLEEVGGRCGPRLKPGRASPVGHLPRHMHFAPAGLEVWGHTVDASFIRDATLRFDTAMLSESMEVDLGRAPMAAPGLPFADDRLWTLARLLAEAADDPDPSSRLYGDGIALAIAARLFAVSTPLHKYDHVGLASWRLRRVIDFLDAHLPQRVELAQLAALAGLSASHFSRAFRASTGMSPYQWQLDSRLRRAQAQMLDTDASLDQVAEATGFADAVHFGRTFRKFTGATPAAWRRDRKL